MERLLGRLRWGGYLPADFPSVETLAVAAEVVDVLESPSDKM